MVNTGQTCYAGITQVKVYYPSKAEHKCGGKHEWREAIHMAQMIASFLTLLYAIIGHYTPLLVIIQVLYYEMGHYSPNNNVQIMPYNVDVKHPHVSRCLYI